MGCSGECCVCSAEKHGGFCATGRGEDGFSPATKEEIIYRLSNGKYPHYYDYMTSYLKNVYGVEFKGLIHENYLCKQYDSIYPIKPMQKQLLTEKEIKSAEDILANGDRVELIPVKDGVRVIRVKREEVKSGNKV
ncbi:MAG: hypothetical protein K2N06_05465 [Oscillospiraceae bacterium]|nr:hypothetical protein [Oscillospiraceae bacterium]